MKWITPTARTLTIATIACALSVGELSPPLVGGQAASSPGQPAPDAVDMTPAEHSTEVQQLLKGSRFFPDRGEPAGAIKAHLETEPKVQRASRRIATGLLPGEPDFDPNQLLDEALIVRQRSVRVYPTSRHAWQGLGDVWWQKYLWQHRAADLRESVNAYTKAAELLVPQGFGSSGATDMAGLASNIGNGLATLSDRAGVEDFFEKLRKTEFWELARDPYAIALGKMNDPGADQEFQKLLLLISATETLPDYVDYLWDQGRYRDALQILDRRPRAKLNATQVGQRGAILERLGRYAEAQAEYQQFLDAVAKIRPWPLLSMPERYRISGSSYQRGIRFRPNTGALPKPTSSLWRWLVPASAWASHVGTGCPSDDWYCWASEYLPRAIHGEAGCINTSSGCWGTVGGQRAVAWNIRTRVQSLLRPWRPQMPESAGLL